MNIIHASRVRLWEAMPSFRWIVPDCTTTEPAKLQQAHRDRNSGDIEWRSVPREVVSLEEFHSLPTPPHTAQEK